MMRTLLLMAALGISVLAAGCATVRPTGAAAPKPKVAPAQQIAPLPPAAIYQALVAETALQRGQFDIAADYYQRLARSVPDAKIAERATRIALLARDDANAQASAKLWLEQDPHSLDARLLLAASQIRRGQIDAALEHLEIVLAAQARTPDRGYAAVISVLSNLPDSKAALATMEKLVARHADDPHAHFAYAQLALRAEALDTARTAIDMALRLKPGWPSAMIVQARVLQLSGDTTKSLEILGEVLKQQPQDMPLRLIYARALAGANRHEEALEQFEKLLKQYPDSPEVLLGTALLSLDLKRFDKAEEYLTRLSRQPKRAAEASFYLGAVAEAKKDHATAKKWYAAVPVGETNYLNAQIRIADILAKQGDVDGARKHLRGLEASDPGQKLRLYLAEGTILFQAGQYNQAIAVYDAALSEVPDNTDLLYGRALARAELGQIDLMEQDLSSIIKREPDNAAALNTLGYTLADRTNRYQEALGYIKRALELRPQDFAIIDSMGWLQFKMGNKEEAIKYLRQAFDMSQDPEIAAHLGEVLWSTGDQSSAKELWQRVIKTAPDHKLLNETMRRFGQ